MAPSGIARATLTGVQALYSKLASGAFWGGVLATVLAVVYGYVFNVWHDIGLAIGGMPDAWIHMSKFDDTVLFSFLAIALFVASRAASGLAGRMRE